MPGLEWLEEGLSGCRLGEFEENQLKIKCINARSCSKTLCPDSGKEFVLRSVLLARKNVKKKLHEISCSMQKCQVSGDSSQAISCKEFEKRLLHPIINPSLLVLHESTPLKE